MTSSQITRVLRTYFPTERDRIIRESALRKILTDLFATADNTETNTTTGIIQAQNIGVVDAADGQLIPHDLATNKLEVSFYLGGELPTNTIGWEPEGPHNIKIYLPITDPPTLFTGDIYIKKRN
jgi:hypothetical protein